MSKLVVPCPVCGHSMPADRFIVDYGDNRAIYGGRSVALTGRQLKLLTALGEPPWRTKTTSEIRVALYGYRAVADGLVYAAVRELRRDIQTIGLQLITADGGGGWRLAPLAAPKKSARRLTP